MPKYDQIKVQLCKNKKLRQRPKTHVFARQHPRKYEMTAKHILDA